MSVFLAKYMDYSTSVLRNRGGGGREPVETPFLLGGRGKYLQHMEVVAFRDFQR